MSLGEISPKIPGVTSKEHGWLQVSYPTIPVQTMLSVESLFIGSNHPVIGVDNLRTYPTNTNNILIGRSNGNATISSTKGCTYNISIGNSNTCFGLNSCYSINIGNGNTSSYNSNSSSRVVIGKNSASNGDKTITIGDTSTTSGAAGNLVIGNNSSATGNSYCATTIGQNHTNSGGIVIGNGGNASVNGIAIGAGANGAAAGLGSGLAIGTSAIATTANSISIGYQTNSNNKSNALMVGASTTADFVGENAWSSGNFATGTISTVKYSVVQLLTQVSNTTPVVMGIATNSANTTTNKITLTNYSVYLFDCDMIVSRVDALTTGSDMAAYNYKFQMYRGSSASALSISAITTTNINNVGGIGSVAITADTTNGCPTFTFTSGNGSVTMRCVITCKITKMTIA